MNVVDPEGLEGLTLNVDDPRFEIRSGQLYLRNEALTEPPGTRITIEISASDALANQTFSQQISLIADDGPTDWDLPGQWKFDPLDVNADGFVTPLDALLVIIRLNAARAGQVTTPSENKPVSQFYDASGDYIVSPLDSLRS